MTKRDISLKKRGTKAKKERVTYLIVAEGRNKTETMYLSHFQEQGKDYYIRFVIYLMSFKHSIVSSPCILSRLDL
jgi:hypothetical protein